MAGMTAQYRGVLLLQERLHHSPGCPQRFTSPVAAGYQQLLGECVLGVADLPVVGDVAVGVGVGLLQGDELGSLESQLDSTGVRGVYPGYNRVQRLFVPPGCVAGLGAEALLLRAGVVLEYNEWLGAEEAEGERHRGRGGGMGQGQGRASIHFTEEDRG